MKNRSLYFLILLVAISGCNKIKDATTLTINTQLKTNIPVVVSGVGMKSADLLASVNSIAFNKSQDLVLGDNVDLASYTARIKQMDLTSVVVTVTGLSTDQTINSVTLNVSGVGDVVTQTNITSTNNSFTPVVTTAMLNAISAKLTADRKITITVSGTASGVMTFSVGINIDSRVVVYTIQ